MKPLRVSVVIPAYNEEKLLARCLISLQNQNVAPYEIIVVDNNSSDGTAEIAKKHGVIVVNETRQGIAWARDAGFNRASGEIIARLDADCIAPKDWISKILDYYNSSSNEEWSALTGNGYYTTRSKFIGKALGIVMITGYNTGNRLMLGSVGMYGSCMAFPRLWWDEIKSEVCPHSNEYHEDIDISVHILEKGHPIKRLKGFYTFIDSRTLREPFKKTLWRWRTWAPSIYRHRQKQDVGQ